MFRLLGSRRIAARQPNRFLLTQPFARYSMICFGSPLPARTALALAASVLALAGCGTTRSTDSLRTATEQLLISDAIDRAVQTVNFEPLRGQTVYLDDQRLADGV